jgi:tetratricopeptide (TPR) repeat protein
MAKSERRKRKLQFGLGTRADFSVRQWPHPARILAAAVVATAMAAEVVRITTAAAVSERNPDLASRLSPFGPTALVSTAMGQVGAAAAKGGDVPELTLEKLRFASAAAPLEPEPFLVNAAIAERKGDLDRAQSLLRFAQQREPRSTAALYLLADVEIRENRILDALRHVALLSRIMPEASVQLVPALASYARAPGALEGLETVLHSNPELRSPLLSALSNDPDNADLVLQLAGPELRSTAPNSQAWKSRLIYAVVKQGDYDRAYALWRVFAGLRSNFSALLFNGEFKTLGAPPPFNWTFNTGSAGIAEPANGKLRVLYYGNVEQSLAKQLLLLKPGTYQFGALASGNPTSGSLAWILTCSTDGKVLMELPVNIGTAEARISVPQSCNSQRLELRGHSQDFPRNSEVQIGPVRLEKVPT